MEPFIVGIAGGSGSGKTTLSKAVLEKVGHDKVGYIQHDFYYVDRSSISPEERANVNYDHPSSLENTLLIKHLKTLLSGYPIHVPLYNFKTHTRTENTKLIEPRKVIILEGILILADTALRALLDLRVFVDTDSDVRVLRRLQRDIDERGRSYDSVIEQYFSTVRPMHLKYVEPSKRYANLIIPEGGLNEMGVDILVQKITSVLNNHEYKLEAK